MTESNNFTGSQIRASRSRFWYH